MIDRSVGSCRGVGAQAPLQEMTATMVTAKCARRPDNTFLYYHIALL
jgi:hypothetical protein